MSLGRAHLLCLCMGLCSPAQACGVIGASERVASVQSGDIVFASGGRARLGGLALGEGAAAALAALVGASPRVAELSPSRDRWGRRVVDLVDTSGQSVALDLLARGLAFVRPERDSGGCDAERLDAESAARVAGEGVWAKPGAALDAADPAALARQDGRFALVSGVVRRVGEGRAKVYLDFAGRNGFSVVVARKAEPLFRRAGVDLRALAGRKVLVRGVVDMRFGPRIEIGDPSMIELLTSAKETGRGG
jgi:Staphylococcal nuclease homologue